MELDHVPLTEWETLDVIQKVKTYILNNTYIPEEVLEEKIVENGFIDFLENCPITAKYLQVDPLARKLLKDDYDTYFR